MPRCPQATPANSGRADGQNALAVFFVENGDPTIDRLPLKDTQVEVAISGVIADVVVRQVYVNRGQRPINARYASPAQRAPPSTGMTMAVGDVKMVAKIKERETARIEFESAERDGKTISQHLHHELANVLPDD